MKKVVVISAVCSIILAMPSLAFAKGMCPQGNNEPNVGVLGSISISQSKNIDILIKWGWGWQNRIDYKTPQGTLTVKQLPAPLFVLYREGDPANEWKRLYNLVPYFSEWEAEVLGATYDVRFTELPSGKYGYMLTDETELSGKAMDKEPWYYNWNPDHKTATCATSIATPANITIN